MTTEMTAKQIANWVGNAISDIAHDQVKMWKEYGDPNETFSEMEAEGIDDIAGAYTDHLFNDAVTLADIMGDRVCDEVGWEDTEARTHLINELRKCHKFKAWQDACTLLER